MVNLAIGFVVGLIVGWNFLPQPIWAQDFIAKLRGKL